MPDQITTVAQLSGYPLGAVFTDIEGGVWMIDSRNPATGACWMLSPETVRMSAKHVLRKWGPLTPVWRPDPTVGSRKVASKSDALPTAEAIADALIRYETSGMCRFGKTCGLCDCGKADETPEQAQTRDAMELDRARAVLALIPPQRCVPSEDGLANVLRDILVRVFEQDKDIVAQDAARAVLALFADQHTVAQVKAEVLREAAVEFDREAAEDWMSTDRPATDDAATRWLRNYHGSIDSTALLLAFRAGQKAATPDGESSWIGDHLRARAAAIESGADR